MAIWFVSETSGTGHILYLADDLSGVAVGDYASGYVSGDYASGTDDRVFTNGYPWKQCTIDAYLSAPLDTGSLHALQGVRATRVNIIGDVGTRADKNIVFNDSELANIDMMMDLDIVADGTSVINGRVAPDTEIVSDDVFLSNDYVMACLKTVPDTAAGVDDAAGANMGTRADN